MKLKDVNNDPKLVILIGILVIELIRMCLDIKSCR